MDRRSKYLDSHQSDRYQEHFKLDLRFDITELELLCSYVVSENRSINRNGLVNLKKTIDMMNLDVYGNNQQCLEKIDFIRKGLSARLDHNLQNRSLIIKDIAGGLGVQSNTIKELDTTEVNWVNNNISSILKYAQFQVEADKGLELLTKLKSSDYASRSSVVEELENWVNIVQNKMREAKAISTEDLTFSLNPEVCEEVIRETYRQATSPRNTLKFGTQALNMLTGGGVHAKRVYVLLGLPGEGKSATLLDMAMQIKKYNPDYQCKDPTKKPCVLLLNMENDVVETVERMFSMIVQHRLEEYPSENDAVQAFKERGLCLKDDSPIDLIIKYKPGLTEDTSYLYKLIDDLSDEGYEVICVLMDYLKRIKSVRGSFGGDLRLELGSIVNEFKILATLKQIPVITASQLNRVATANIDNARTKNKQDLVRLLGRANVAESNLILENSDWIALIAPEIAPDGSRYLGIQRVKQRYYIPDGFNCVYMPYLNKSIKLIEDSMLPQPVHKLSMGTSDEIKLNNGMSSNIMGAPKPPKLIDDEQAFDITVNNVFQNAVSFVSLYTGEIAPFVRRPPKKRKKKLYTLIDPSRG